MPDYQPGDEPPDDSLTGENRDWGTDYELIDERRRAREQREAAGASRDLEGGDLAGGSA